MFRTLLTPLSARFPLSPFSARPDNTTTAAVPSAIDEVAPEDFARDVVIEVMRTALERLRQVQGLAHQLEARPCIINIQKPVDSLLQELSQIYRIMLEHDYTKDVFREMDGFLMLMSILSTMDLSSGSTEQINSELVGGICLVFQTLSEAIHKSAENSRYFSVCRSNSSRYQLSV